MINVTFRTSSMEMGRDRQNTDRTGPRRGVRRRDHILDAATQVFMEEGYAGASIDRIVQLAGGSKATLYRHFNGKAELFAAIMETLVAQMVAPIERPAAHDPASGNPVSGNSVAGNRTGLAATLSNFARTYLDVLLEPHSLALYRMVMAEAARFPDLGQGFFERGPGRVAAQLADYLRQEGRDSASVPVELQAREFLSLARADLHLRALLGVEIADAPTRAAVVARAVEVFLRQNPAGEGARVPVSHRCADS